jgi:beta-phosphoglucomutase-like phosphatase (HAD superfamily)
VKGFFDTVPIEIEEAAWVDGATRLTAAFRVVLPLAGPVVAAADLIGFIGAWNQFLVPLVLISDQSKMPISVGMFRASKNCDAVLEAAGIQDLFEVRVDGNVAAEKKLAGKPAPETYEEAARMLGTLPEQAVVIEDAISGVQAGRTGGFGLVIGVARDDDPEVLRQNGADVVVRDLAEVSLV